MNDFADLTYYKDKAYYSKYDNNWSLKNKSIVKQIFLSNYS